MNIWQHFFFLRKLTTLLSLLLPFFIASTAMASMVGQLGFQPESIDHSVSPTNDFYRYANANWLLANPIPESESRWGTFNILRKNNTRQVHYILQAAAENMNAAQNSEVKKIGDFYATAIDTDKANQLGLTPLRPELEMISRIKNHYDLQATLKHFQLHGIEAMFNIGQMQDFKDSKQIIAVLDQGGLGLPDRDYYFRQDSKSLNIRNAYLRHLATLFRMLGNKQKASQNIAKSILSIETELAKISMTRTQRRDPSAIYNLLSRKELAKLMPSFAWNKYFADLGLSDVENINVANLQYFRSLNQLLKNYSLDKWKNYLRWHLIDATAKSLSAPFVSQDFSFKSVLSGSKEIKPRWQRASDEANRILGFAIGHIYVDLYFPSASKQRVIDMLENIRKSLRKNINGIQWMAPSTRQAALEKLAAMRHKIGYPDSWRDHSQLIVSRDSYARNVLNGNAFLIRRELDKIGKTTNRNEWLLTPQSVNAYYNPSMNEIVFPAGILQPPFFDSAAHDALNYGAIGAVLGHEISHAFDDQGSQFDANGNLHNWWTKNDKKYFKKSASCISKQFQRYTVDGDAQVQGKLVTGEAIADLLGLKLSWQAYSTLHNNSEIIEKFNLSSAKLFYFGFAHIWASNARPEYLRTRVQTDPHPPASFRVNGSLINFPAFAKTFNVKPGDNLYKQMPCVIW